MSEKTPKFTESPTDRGRLCAAIGSGLLNTRSMYFELSRQRNLLKVQEHVHHTSETRI